MNKPEDSQSPQTYYASTLKNPLLAPLDKLPTGAELKLCLGNLPPKPDATVRSMPARDRVDFLSELRKIHVPLGRDVQVATMFFELMRDGYHSRNPTPQAIRRRSAQVSALVQSINAWGDTDIEAVGGALIGMSGTGKTRTLKRILTLIDQVIIFDLKQNPMLPPKMVTYIRVECPSNHSLKALIASIFSAIEHAIGERLPAGLKKGNVSVLVQNVAQVCLDLCLGVLIIDEIQHILHRDGEPEEELLNFLVELSNKLEVPIFLIGTPLAEKVIARQMRQARRMLGPEWSNLKKDSKAWADFISELWEYQFTRDFTPFAEVADTFYELTQGVPALAVTLFRLTQRYAIAMETPNEKGGITTGLLETVAGDHFKSVQPMINALKSGDPDRIGFYDDLQVNAESEEEEFLAGLAEYREHCRIKLRSSTKRAYKRAKKLVNASVANEAAALAGAA